MYQRIPSPSPPKASSEPDVVGEEMSLSEKISRWDPELEGRGTLRFHTFKSWSIGGRHHSTFNIELDNEANFNRLAESAVACQREMWSIVTHPELHWEIAQLNSQEETLRFHKGARYAPEYRPKPIAMGRAALLRKKVNEVNARSKFSVGRAERLQHRVAENATTAPGGLRGYLRQTQQG